MKVTRVRLRSLIRESIRTIYEAAKDYVCPPATQDVAINTKNRNATRKYRRIFTTFKSISD